jgi:transcriptional regulator with XRE-family HTH domain
VTNRGVPGFDPARLRRLREQRGFIASQLADRAGVSRSAVSQYEAGRVAPNADTLALLARALDVPPISFVDVNELGDGLLALRIAAGLTQAEVMERLSAHAYGDAFTLSRYKALELGRIRRLTNADAIALGATFAVSPDAVRAAHRWTVERTAGAQ